MRNPARKKTIRSESLACHNNEHSNYSNSRHGAARWVSEEMSPLVSGVFCGEWEHEISLLKIFK